ncbi:MAG: hypothetical protein CK431_04460 [Mycobacterium sp.]|nr:MAG: hypothetical protein CK431_04460 [Mycobacterium sp.]
MNTPENQLSEIRQRIEGKRIVAVENNGETLILDDGTRLRLYESAQDCCASARGDWVIQPDALQAIITDVKITPDEARSGDDGDGTTNYATVAILHNQNPIALADCYANDGNGGYYFSVLSLNVAVPGADDAIDMEVVSA